MAESKQDMFNRLMADLPPVCADYLLNTATEKAISSRIEYARELMRFCIYLGGQIDRFKGRDATAYDLDDFRSIMPQDVSRYLNLYKNEDHAERTIARKRASLSSFYKYLVNNKLAEFNPVLGAANVKIHKSDNVIHLTVDEQNTLLSCIAMGTGLSPAALKRHEQHKKRDLALVTLLLDTGMRVSEIQQADIKDLNLESFYIIVTRKGGNHQTIYYSNEAAEYIQEYLKERYSTGATENDPIFISNQGSRMTVRTIENMVKNYAVTALPGKGQLISPHKLRSSFAMGFYEATGNDILMLQKALGHKDLQATNIYAKATEKKMQEARNKMADWRNSSILK